MKTFYLNRRAWYEFILRIVSSWDYIGDCTYTSFSGVCIKFTYDSNDNVICAYNGLYTFKGR